jgi:hypothetical protein
MENKKIIVMFKDNQKIYDTKEWSVNVPQELISKLPISLKEFLADVELNNLSSSYNV